MCRRVLMQNKSDFYGSNRVLFVVTFQYIGTEWSVQNGKCGRSAHYDFKPRLQGHPKIIFQVSHTPRSIQYTYMKTDINYKII